MVGVLDLFVMLTECKPIADDEQLAAVNRELNRELKELGFENVDEVRQRMELPVKRLLQARKLADEQLLILAREGL